MHGAIEPTKYAEVTAQRRDVLFLGVADAHGENVCAVLGEVFGQFKTKRTERPAMLAERLAVQINIRHRTRRLKAHEVTAIRFRRANVERAPIPARAAQIFFAALRLLPTP